MVVGGDAVGALPHQHVAFVVDGAVVVGGDHAARLGLQRLVAGKHLRILLGVVFRHAAGIDVAVGGEIAGALVHADAVGGGGAGGVPHVGVAVQHDHVLVGIERGLGGARLAVAFLVS